MQNKIKVQQSDNILFQNQFLAVIERDGYTFSCEVRSDGVIVSLLPFQSVSGGQQLEFLARLEVCPAQGLELELCSITGGLEPGHWVEETACQELWEEAGYRVEKSELINLGTVRPSKSSDTTVYLFAVDVTRKSHSTPPSDGNRFEERSSVEWVNYEQGIQITDPLFITAITQLQGLSKKGGQIKV